MSASKASEELPRKISPCPLIDAIVELRFETDLLSDAVFGIIYQKIRTYYEKVEKLPILQVPDEIRLKDPDLAFKPYYRMSKGTFVLQIGPKVLTVSCPGEYVGWETISQEIMNTFTMVSELGIVKKFVRLGIRYINFFDFNIFDRINLTVFLDESPLMSNQAMVRAIVPGGRFQNTLQIANNVNVTSIKKKSLFGSIIDIDTFFSQEIDDFFPIMADLLEEGHQEEKALFFRLLRQDYLATLNPEY